MFGAVSPAWVYKYVLSVYERPELLPALLGSAQFRRVLTLKLDWDLEEVPGFPASASMPHGSCSISLGVWPLEGQEVHGKGTWFPPAPCPPAPPSKTRKHPQTGKGAEKEHLVGQVLG